MMIAGCSIARAIDRCELLTVEPRMGNRERELTPLDLTPIEAFLARDWILQAWVHRYGGDMTVAIAPAQYQIELLRELTGSGDIEACAFDEYLANDGRWLPIVRGADPLPVVLAALAERLAPHVHANRQPDDHWMEAVRTAYDKLNAASDGEDGIARAIDRRELLTDPFVSQKRS